VWALTIAPRLAFRAVCLSIVCVACLVSSVAVAAATPIARNDQGRAQYGGRVLPEPRQMTDYLQFGGNGAEPEFAHAFEYLARLYPRYIRLTTMAQELGTPNAVSTGPDGIAAGVPGDTGDGKPLYLIVLTDKTVPDPGKKYVVLTFAHSAETCGREGVLHSVEDLAAAAASGSSAQMTDGAGLTGVTHSATAAELLAHEKIFIAVTSPDGWAAGDNRGSYSQKNGAGINSNRMTYNDGWSYFGPKLASLGYATATQPEGLAFTTYLRRVREKELHGKPFAAGADLHGPFPSGTALLQDQGNDPTKLIAAEDYAARTTAAMDGVFASEVGSGGVAVNATGEALIAALRVAGFNFYTLPDAGFIQPQWVSYGGIFDQIGYTHGSGWAAWMNGRSGLDAPSITYEINCVANPQGGRVEFNPVLMQLFVDNVRAIVRATLVRALFPNDDGVKSMDLGGLIGFYETGHRLRSTTNSTPPPVGFPKRPLLEQVTQAPYDVSQTDYFRDLGRELVSSPVIAVSPAKLRDTLPKVATFAVADAVPEDAAALESFVRRGGNLVLTDRALQLLPRLGIGRPADVSEAKGYVGYGDLDLSDPLAAGLPDTARQTYDPIGLGYQTLMERDPYDTCAGTAEQCDTGTTNSAPIWSISKDAFAGSGAPAVRVVATVDPPNAPKATTEGHATNRIEIGTFRYGRGRISFFGALLPEPTDANPHWYGLDGYTISYAGQTMLLRALVNRADAAACHGTQSVRITLKLRRGERVRYATVTLNGRPVAVPRSMLRRGRVWLSFPRHPDRRFVLRIRALTTHGRLVRVTRRYHTCPTVAAAATQRVSTRDARADPARIHP
jgi:hypothetical protein